MLTRVPRGADQGDRPLNTRSFGSSPFGRKLSIDGYIWSVVFTVGFVAHEFADRAVVDLAPDTFTEP